MTHGEADVQTERGTVVVPAPADHAFPVRHLARRNKQFRRSGTEPGAAEPAPSPPADSRREGAARERRLRTTCAARLHQPRPPSHAPRYRGVGLAAIAAARGRLGPWHPGRAVRRTSGGTGRAPAAPARLLPRVAD